MNKRIEWIDFLRGFVIFLVVFGHVNLGLIGYEVFEIYKKGLTELYYLFHSFRMPLFFMVSGFLYASKINNNVADLIKSLKKKAIAWGIPYIVFSVLFWWIKYFMGDKVNTILTWKDLYLIPIQPIEHFWFLYVLFLIYCLVETLDYVFKNNFIVFTVIICLAIISWRFHSGVFIIDTTLNMVIYFYIAKLLRGHINFINNKIFIAIGVLTFIVLRGIDFESTYHAEIRIIIAISISLPIIAICSLLKTENAFFKYFTVVGKNTLPIYILHPPIASAVRMFLFKVSIDNIILHLVIGTLVAWFLSLYIYKFASKFRIMDSLFYPLKYLKVISHA